MSFMDYIQKKEGGRGTGGGVGLKMRQPLVNVLLGQFEEQELKPLVDGLSRYVSGEGQVFWMSSRSAGDRPFLQIPIPETDRYSYQDRVRLEKYVIASEELHQETDRLVRQIFNQTTERSFSEQGRMRLNFLVKPDEADGGMLAPLSALLLKQFGSFFNVDVDIEVYLLADQTAMLERQQERKAMNYRTLAAANTMMQERTARLAYFLSNVDNDGRFHLDLGERLTAVVLLMLAKAAVPDYVPEARMYSDADFGEAVTSQARESNMPAGSFGSVGYLHLECARNLARLAACQEVWEQLSAVRENLGWEQYLEELEADPQSVDAFLKGGTGGVRITEREWRSIVRKREHLEEQMIMSTKGELIEEFYGKNLDLYLQLNYGEQQDQGERLEKWCGQLQGRLDALTKTENLTPFETEQLLQLLLKNLEEYRSNAGNLCTAARDKLQKWKNSRGRDLSKKKTEASRESITVFFHAQEYLKMKWELESARRLRGRCDTLIDRVKQLAYRYGVYTKLVKDACDELKNGIFEEQNSAGEQTARQIARLNGDVYYSRVAKDILNGNENFARLGRELAGQVCREDFVQAAPDCIYERVMRFCQEEILSDPRYQADFMEEIYGRLKGYRAVGSTELKTAEDISDYLLRKADEYHYYLCSETFGGHYIHQEMCMYMNPDAEFVGVRNTQSSEANRIRSDKLRMFCRKGFHDLDVLYIAGNIRMESILQFDQYKEAWKLLTGGEENAEG